MFVEYECFEFPPPDPQNNATCKNPDELTVKEIQTELADGSWYVTYGYNPDYDCFDCQINTLDFKFELPREKVTYSAYYNLIASNHTEIWNYVVMPGEKMNAGMIEFNPETGWDKNDQRFYFLL